MHDNNYELCRSYIHHFLIEWTKNVNERDNNNNDDHNNRTFRKLPRGQIKSLLIEHAKNKYIFMYIAVYMNSFIFCLI